MKIERFKLNLAQKQKFDGQCLQIYFGFGDHFNFFFFFGNRWPFFADIFLLIILDFILIFWRPFLFYLPLKINTKDNYSI